MTEREASGHKERQRRQREREREREREEICVFCVPKWKEETEDGGI